MCAEVLGADSARHLNKCHAGGKALYQMSRDQRGFDN